MSQSNLEISSTKPRQDICEIRETVSKGLEITSTKPRQDLCEIRDTVGKGRGLFATQKIVAGTLIERAPCIRVPKLEYEQYLKHTVLEHYVFTLKCGDVFVSLGNGSIFNHSQDPNIDYRIIESNNEIEYYAIRKGGVSSEGEIKKDEELCIYYGPRPEWDVYSESDDESDW